MQAQAIQGLPTIRSPIDPSSSSPPSSSPSVSTTTPSEAQPELKRPASVGPGGLQRTPSPSSIKLANRNSITASQNPSSESLVEKRGTSKGRGRVLKALGDLSLLCGIIPGAIVQYTQSVEILRLTTDYLWHASALEGVGIALVLLSYLKVEYPVIRWVTKTGLTARYPA
jgi:Transport protein Trs120 or TRAPPC9, TRAPP II complex subunit